MILDSIENKRKILAQFLEICAFEGWSNATLSKACELSAIDVKFLPLIFENGCLDLIEFYIAEQSYKLSATIEATPDFAGFKVREKIKFALYSLFENEKKHQLVLQRLRNFYFDLKNFSGAEYGPRPLFMAFKHVGKVSDFIWDAIGDKSTDFNFYTKRLTLSKIILQTFVIFIKDESEDLSVTRKFIDLQIEKVMKFEKFKAKVKNFSANLKENSCEFFYDEVGNVKTPKQVLRDLPFIRLFKK